MSAVLEHVSCIYQSGSNPQSSLHLQLKTCHHKQFIIVFAFFHFLCRSQDPSAGGDASSPGSGQSESTCGTPPTNPDTVATSTGRVTA